MPSRRGAALARTTVTTTRRRLFIKASEHVFPSRRCGDLELGPPLRQTLQLLVAF